LTQEEYQSFAKKVVEAQQLAKQEKLGIWSDSKQ
jgi:endonuclease YncB( thermonuclease family)